MVNRRNIIKQTFLLSLGINCIPNFVFSKKKGSIIYNTIPKTLEKIPAIGMGTWLTFDVGYNPKLINERAKVLKVFLDFGGNVIDSSPMYGTSERVIGKCLNVLGNKHNIFSASKVWTPNAWDGKVQISNSKKYWDNGNFNLMQVHNLLNYHEHLDTLLKLKEKKELSYIGITTSHLRRHDKVKHIIKNYNIDFVQLTYNILDTEAEEELLRVAYESNIAVIANRPFQGGNLFFKIKNKSLPNWIRDLNINSWAELFLMYVISNEAVTCAIPATTNINHMKENMRALYGNKLTVNMRRKIRNYYIDL